MTDDKPMTISDKNIVSAAKADPDRGFSLLMDKYKEAVYWHIRRLVGTHADAQDAAQDTFVRIYRSLRKFRGDGRLKPWVYRIATNEALRLLSQRQGRNMKLDADAPAVKQLVADGYVDYGDLEAVRLQKAILSLPTKQQLAFNLRYYDELPYDEIAAITGSTPAAAKANYSIAKSRIIEYMNSND